MDTEARENQLRLHIENTKELWDAIQPAALLILNTVDLAAKQCTKANKEWHDDPEADDYKDYHAPTDEQFPADVRKEVALEILRYIAVEKELGNY